MSESFVDLTYRGLALGRRIKLTQVRPSSAYLEMPAPMPVGSAISIATDDGLLIDAVVTQIREQVGGIEQAPGMMIAPRLGGVVADWWKQRVTLPDEPPRQRPRTKVTVRPRTQTQETPPPTITDRMPTMVIEDDNTKRTSIMNAADQELLEQLTRSDESEAIGRAEHPVVDDGKRTTIMESVDPATLEALTAGTDTPNDDDADDGDDKPKPNGNGTSTGTVKRRRKRR